MTTPTLRGYMVHQAVAFIESGYFEPDVGRRIMDSLPKEVALGLPNVKHAEWYPREYLMEIMKGIARVKNNDAGAYQDLVAYGSYVATEATNTFLKLLLKMLTPTLFAKKVPDFWQRDHRGSGHFEADVQNAGEGLIRMRLLGAGGFDHVGITAIGFITCGLKTMGKKDVQVTQRGWSLATPSPDEISYEVRWS